MITRTSRAPKRIAATAAAVAMVGSALALSGTTALADHVPAITYGGADRYETATLVADALPSVATITVANGLDFPDGLAGAFLEDAILLTEADTLHPTTEAWLDANNAEITNIQIVGGEAVVSAAVATELATYGTVTRLSGPTRYDTAVDIAEAQSPDATEIIVADGLDFPDALASGPLAIEADAPIILNDGATLRPEVAAYLAANPQIDDAYIVGGNAAVPTTVEVQLTGLGITVERLSGPTRDETAVAIANELQELTGGYDTGAVIANRLRFADAMVAGPLGAEEDYPILLVAEEALTVATEDYLVENCATIGTIIAVGGEGVINATTSEAARQAATCAVASNQTFTATPAGNQTGQAGTVQQFSFSGLTPGGRVDIQLVDCGNVATDANGVTTFSGTNPGGANNVAQNDSAPTANVNVVNGVASGSTDQVLVPSTGTVTFSVDTTGDAGSCFVAVVFNDADGDNRIDLNPDGTPTEAFGTTGDITVIAAEAADLTNPGTVTFVDLANDLFSTVNGTFFYDSNDEFILASSPANTPLTLEQFEARLSVGDSVAGTYRSDPANQSSFTLTDAAPLPPATLTAQAPGDDGQTANVGKQGVQLNFPQSLTATTVSYNVNRATAIQPTVIGQFPTCPTSPAAYTVVGTVADTATATQYYFVDETAVPPATGTTNPQYCYTVTSVDQTGDQGPASEIEGPVSASAATTAASMSFQAGADNSVVNANTLNVDFNNVVNGATVALNGSDFTVTATTTGANPISEDITVLSATKNSADAEGDLVTITTSEAIPAGTVVTVTSKTGTDANTVCAGTTTTNCQPVGQTVQLTAGDVTGPVANDASFVDDATDVDAVFGDDIGDVITVTYDGNVVLDGVATITVGGATYTDGAVVDLTVAANVLTATVLIATATDVTITDGVTAVTGTTNVEDAAGNAATGYPELIN